MKYLPDFIVFDDYLVTISGQDPGQFNNHHLKEIEMSKPLETITYVNGRDVNQLDEEALIGEIQKLQAKQKELSKLSVTSTKLLQRVQDCQKAIDLCVEKIDGGKLLEEETE